jgi:hypothetical protein
MAAGCAVVVSSLRCFDDFIEDGVSGLKFDHRRADAGEKLGGDLLRLIAQPQLLAQIASNGQVAAHGFRISAIAARMLDDFASLAGGRT